METNVNWMQQGWECPKCGAVMSPHTDCCVNCRGNKGGGTATTTPNSYTVKADWTGDDPVFNHPSSICGTSSPLDPPYTLINKVPESKYATAKENPEEQWERYQLNV